MKIRIGIYSIFICFAAINSYGIDDPEKNSSSKFGEHAGGLHSIAISPDGTKLATASSDYTVKIWDVKTKKLLHTLKDFDYHITVVKITPDGTQLVTGSAGREHGLITVWDLNSGTFVRKWSAHKTIVRSVAISDDGKMLATGGGDSSVILWELKTGKEIHCFRGHEDQIRSVSFGQKSTLLASGGDQGSLRLWSMRSRKQIAKLDVNSSINIATFFPKKKALAIGTENSNGKGGIIIWNYENEEIERRFQSDISGVTCIAIMPNETNLISSGSSQDGQHGRLQCWDMQRKERLTAIEYHMGEIREMVITPDAQLITGSVDKTIRIIPLKEVIRKIPTDH